MQADRRLARSGATLDHEHAVGVVRDQAVLVGLDRRDDVAHVHVAVALELLEQEVADRGAVDDRAVESLVRDVDHRAALGAEASAQRDAVRILRGRRVERACRRGLPVHDQLPLLLVVHPAPPDVERAPHRLDVEPQTTHSAIVGPTGVECMEAARG